MRRIPPEIERLMWLVAEQNDPQAIAEFQARFPDLRDDLAKHMAMVSGLKGAKKQLAARRDIPAFRPRTAQARPANRLIYVMAAAVLGAVAVASYSVTSWIGRPSSPPNTHAAPVVNLEKPPATEESTQFKQPPAVDPQASGAPSTDATQGEALKVEPEMQPVTLRSENVPLQAAIVMVGQSAKLQIEFAPGVPNFEVSLSFDNVPALQALEQMGVEHGFTAFPQERGKILIVPARPVGDPTAPDTATDAPGPYEPARDQQRGSGGAAAGR